MAENWRAAFARRIAGIPNLARVPVAREGVVDMPDRLRYSDFATPSTVRIEMFPGDPPMVADHFVSGFPRPDARRRHAPPALKVPAPTPQTVSNLRRAELSGIEAVPPARLDIFEGVV